jgi:uncharacterized spore protein YtfJ
MSTSTLSSPTLPEPLRPITDLLDRTVSIRHVYGEPIHVGERTVIPVARVAFGFGGGGGAASRPAATAPLTAPADAGRGSGGGGGGVRLVPAGALELSPRRTRFIRFGARRRWAGAFALGLATGALLARRRR